MKPTIISLFLLLLVSGATTSCDKDEPDGKSIFVDPAEEKTEFDFWLDRHYTEPYNIRFEYRMPDRETHFNYWVSPPPVDKSDRKSTRLNSSHMPKSRMPSSA